MSIADFMFTPGIQRVLGAMLAHPERTFTLQELLRLAASGRGSTQQQIDRLVQAGVLQDEPRRGRQRSIRVNTSFALYPELSSIARKSFGLVEPLRAALLPYASQLEQAFVFGSVAKGSDTYQSDIDLVITGTAPLLDLSEALHQAEQMLGRPIRFSLYSPAEWSGLIQSDPVLAQIAKGPKLMVLDHAQTT